MDKPSLGDLSSIKNSPPQPICEIQAKALKLKADLRIKKDEVKKQVNEAIERIASIRWGLVSLTPDDMMATVTNISTSIASNIAVSASAIVKDSVSKIIAAMLLAFTTAESSLYGIASVPHKKALNTAFEESTEIERILSNISIIRSVIQKWDNRTAPADNISAMKKLIPIIDEIIVKMTSVIDDLEKENSYFDDIAYTDSLDLIKEAIDIASPSTPGEKMLKIKQNMKDNRQEILEEDTKNVKKYWNDKRDNASKEYLSEIAKSDNKINKAKSLVKYKATIESIDSREKADLSKSEINAELKSIGNYFSEDIGREFNDTVSEYSDDMLMVLNKLLETIKSVGIAQGLSLKTQMYCNTLYSFEHKIDRIINVLIELVTKIGNKAGDAALMSINTALASVEVSKDLIEEGLESALNPKGVTPSTSAVKIVESRAMLVAADTLLASTIFDKLKELINRDDRLSETADLYKQFTVALYNIPDSSGKVGVWAPKPLLSSIPEYVGTVRDLTLLSASGAISGGTWSEKTDQSISGIIDAVTRSKDRNSIVINALTSWRPPETNSSVDFSIVLKALGLLDVFAMTGDLTSLLGALGVFSGDLGDWKSCEEAYPELYEDDSIVEEDYLTKRDFKFDIADSPTNTLNSLESISILNSSFNKSTFNINFVSNKDMIRTPGGDISSFNDTTPAFKL